MRHGKSMLMRKVRTLQLRLIWILKRMISIKCSADICRFTTSVKSFSTTKSARISFRQFTSSITAPSCAETSRSTLTNPSISNPKRDKRSSNFASLARLTISFPAFLYRGCKAADISRAKGNFCRKKSGKPFGRP